MEEKGGDGEHIDKGSPKVGQEKGQDIPPPEGQSQNKQAPPPALHQPLAIPQGLTGGVFGMLHQQRQGQGGAERAVTIVAPEELKSKKWEKTLTYQTFYAIISLCLGAL